MAHEISLIDETEKRKGTTQTVREGTREATMIVGAATPQKDLEIGDLEGSRH